MVQYLQGLILIGWALPFVACVLLYIDGKGQRQALAAAQRVIEAHGQELVRIRQMIVALPMSARVEGSSMSFQPTPGQIEAARVAEEKATIRARWNAEEDARDRETARRAALNAAALRAAEAGTPASERRTAQLPPRPVAVPNDRPTILGGVAPEQRDSDGETRILELPVGWSDKRGPWVETTQLSAGTLATIDRMAAERGTTREAMAADLARTGIDAEEGRAAGPTTPPEGPANDAPKGKR